MAKKKSTKRTPRGPNPKHETAPTPIDRALRAARRAGVVAPADYARETIRDAILMAIDPTWANRRRVPKAGTPDYWRREAAEAAVEGIDMLIAARLKAGGS